MNELIMHAVKGLGSPGKLEFYLKPTRPRKIHSTHAGESRLIVQAASSHLFVRHRPAGTPSSAAGPTETLVV